MAIRYIICFTKFLHYLWDILRQFKSLDCLFIDGVSYYRGDSNEGLDIPTFYLTIFV